MAGAVDRAAAEAGQEASIPSGSLSAAVRCATASARPTPHTTPPQFPVSAPQGRGDRDGAVAERRRRPLHGDGPTGASTVRLCRSVAIAHDTRLTLRVDAVAPALGESAGPSAFVEIVRDCPVDVVVRERRPARVRGQREVIQVWMRAARSAPERAQRMWPGAGPSAGA